MEDESVLPVMNDMLAQCSLQCQEDAVAMHNIVKQLHKRTFDASDQLNAQLQVCAVITTFLSWATIHPEDFDTIVEWWNSEVVPKIHNARSK